MANFLPAHRQNKSVSNNVHPSCLSSRHALMLVQNSRQKDKHQHEK